MLAHEIRLADETEIVAVLSLESDAEFTLKAGTPVEIRWLVELDEIVLSARDNHWPISGLDSAHQRRLENVVAQNRPRLCVVIEAIPKDKSARRIILSIKNFEYEQSLGNEKADILLSDGTLEDLKRIADFRGNPSHEDMIEWLNEQFVVLDTASPAAIISGAPDDTFEQIPRGFRLYGKEIVADIRRSNDGYRIVRFSRIQRIPRDTPVTLLRTQLTFRDVSTSAEFTANGSTLLDTIIAQSNGSYLRVWEEYNRIEHEQLVQKARKAGWIQYSAYIHRDEGWELEVSSSSRQFTKWLDGMSSDEDVILELSGTLPPELDSHNLDDGNWTDERPESISVRYSRRENNNNHLFVIPLDEDDVRNPPSKGYVHISLIGDRVRLNRRREAWDRIRSLHTPIPQLAFLVENSDHYRAPDHPRRVIRRNVIKRAFDSEPTENQLRAIEIAIQTPDIALIQGPPGTGKTHVIAALSKLIADEHAKNQKRFGRTLLTSYQHDAVEHVASVTRVYGLPAVKVGQRHRTDSDFDAADTWRQEKLRELKKTVRPDTPIRSVLKNAKSILLGYVELPTTSRETANMLRDLYADAAVYLEGRTAEALIRLINELEQPFSIQDAELDLEAKLLERLIRGLRSDIASFRDDGPKNAYKLLFQLRELSRITESDDQLLQAASEWSADDAPNFLEDLKRLQEQLLDNIAQPRQLEQSMLINADVVHILSEIINDLSDKSRNEPGNTDQYVWDFMQDLELDPFGTKAAVLHYSASLAATCQQSVGNKMQRLYDNNINFHTVIVDEAARANPLDLMIPIANASRRIILVGDHRQLPHLLEPLVEREMEMAGEEAKEALSKSLFERLFMFARELERKDGIPRTVTLDHQFRMHPVLGKFVSGAFYQPYHEGFGSPLAAEHFVHNIEPYQGKVAVWKSVPKRYGEEQGRQSKFRYAEARQIAEEARRILQNFPDVSVGVITFYSAQVRAIFKEMVEVGLANSTEDGYRISEEYTEDGQERLRVGTVDAFQGKEFDVVLLSITRSNSIRAANGDKVSQRQKYGFLSLENRLCVAMSRQKRLLIVFGDDEIITASSAKEAVPGLVAFYELCRGDHGICLSS